MCTDMWHLACPWHIDLANQVHYLSMVRPGHSWTCTNQVKSVIHMSLIFSLGFLGHSSLDQGCHTHVSPLKFERYFCKGVRECEGFIL